MTINKGNNNSKRKAHVTSIVKMTNLEYIRLMGFLQPKMFMDFHNDMVSKIIGKLYRFSKILIQINLKNVNLKEISKSNNITERY